MQCKIYQRAVADYTACLKLHDDLAGTHLHREKAYDAQGRHDLAQNVRTAAAKSIGDRIVQFLRCDTKYSGIKNDEIGCACGHKGCDPRAQKQDVEPLIIADLI